MTPRPNDPTTRRPDDSSPPKAIELIPKGFESGDPLYRTDATPVKLTMVDDRNREYFVRFTFRNDFTGIIKNALKRLIPVKRIR